MCLEDLARSVARQAVDELDRLRDLVATERAAAEFRQVLRLRRATGPQHNQCLDGLAPAIVRNADHGNVEDVSRAYEKGETEGFMKVLVDAESKQILGATFLGSSGDEAIHCVLDTMYAKAPYTVLQRAVHIHPTVAEFIPTMLGDLSPLPKQA